MRRLLLPLLLIGAPALADDAPARGFFDGKSLDGWEGLTEYWSVKDGAIVGSTEPKGINFNTFLCSKKKFKDFELSFQIRLKDGKGNSGVQIRSEIFDSKRFAVKGPQCDIGEGYWGSLYGEEIGGMMKASTKEMIAKAVKPADFNDYKIRCVGQHVTITINGTTMVDGDFSKMMPEGIIAFQIHGGGSMEVTFRNFQFREVKSN